MYHCFEANFKKEMTFMNWEELLNNVDHSMDSFLRINREHWQKMGPVHIPFTSFFHCSKNAFGLVSSNLIFLGRIIQIKNS